MAYNGSASMWSFGQCAGLKRLFMLAIVMACFSLFLNAGSLALHLEPREFHDGLAFQMSIAYEFSRPNSLFLPVCSIVLITPMCPGC
jgi:hypothetical protein